MAYPILRLGNRDALFIPRAVASLIELGATLGPWSRVQRTKAALFSDLLLPILRRRRWIRAYFSANAPNQSFLLYRRRWSTPKKPPGVSASELLRSSVHTPPEEQWCATASSHTSVTPVFSSSSSRMPK